MSKKGRKVGLFSDEQVRNENSLTYFGAVLVGLMLLLLALLRFVSWLDARRAETEAFGSADRHLLGLVPVVVIALVGILVAHAGLFYFGRRALEFGKRLWKNL